MKKENCIFCDDKRINEGILDETENFYLRANMKGATAPGHCMVISKSHFSCFGEMPSYLDEEYLDFVGSVEERVESAFSKPILIEQGLHAQSINHAHLHFLPSSSEWYDFTRGKHFVDFIPPEILITPGEDIKDVRRVFEKEGQYVTIEEQGKLYICHTFNYNDLFRPGREFPAKLTGLTHLLYWQTMPDVEKEKNRIWIDETIQRLRRK